MKGFNFSTASTMLRTAQRSPTWTCSQCLWRSRTKQIRGFAETRGTYRSGDSTRQRRRGRVVLAAAGGALALSVISLTVDMKHAYGAVERSGRVASTLAVCINE